MYLVNIVLDILLDVVETMFVEDLVLHSLEIIIARTCHLGDNIPAEYHSQGLREINKMIKYSWGGEEGRREGRENSDKSLAGQSEGQDRKI